MMFKGYKRIYKVATGVLLGLAALDFTVVGIAHGQGYIGWQITALIVLACVAVLVWVLLYYLQRDWLWRK